MSALILFEPDNLAPFGPLTLLQSVGELRYGIYSNIQRSEKLLPQHQLSLWVRPILAAIQEERFPALSINHDADDQSIFLNASLPAWIYPELITRLEKENSGVIMEAGIIIAAKPGKALNFSSQFHAELQELKHINFELKSNASLPQWIWDYLDLVNPAMEFDLELWKAENNYLPKLSDDFSMLHQRNIFIHNTSQVTKYTHFDASRGPIIIDKDSKIGPYCSLEGPLYIGKRSSLRPSTAIRSSVVSSVCNIGGEIKGSLIHPFSNKSHDGFLGDSILGSWVNLGAGTTTSNLKNNYSSVRVSMNGVDHDTGRQFLGSIIGDHTKTAIGLHLNTGTSIGAFCNVFGADFPPRFIPSFSWGYGSHELDRAIKTAQIVIKRRGLELSDQQIKLIRSLADNNNSFTKF